MKVIIGILLLTASTYAQQRLVLTQAQRDSILADHNSLRRATAKGQTDCKIPNYCPRGSIPDLEWDSGLEKLAQNLADTCRTFKQGHESGAVRGARFKRLGGGQKFSGSSAGENLAWGRSSITTAGQRWGANEAVDYVWNKKFQYKAGHFTQMIWAKTKYVGCGWKTCSGSGTYGGVLVCNYYPPGNYPTYPYEMISGPTTPPSPPPTTTASPTLAGSPPSTPSPTTAGSPPCIKVSNAWCRNIEGKFTLMSDGKTYTNGHHYMEITGWANGYGFKSKKGSGALYGYCKSTNIRDCMQASKWTKWSPSQRKWVKDTRSKFSLCSGSGSGVRVPTKKPTTLPPQKAPIKAKDGLCPIEKGFCVMSNGRDQNSGVIKVNSVNGNSAAAKKKCLAACRARPGATGCEVIWDQSNRGCYIHTRSIARGNNAGRHSCWVFSKCKDKTTTSKAPTKKPSPTPPPAKASQHIILWGKPSSRNAPKAACTSDLKKISTKGKSIGVTCCKSETTKKGSRPNCKKGLTYSAAESHCKSKGMMLCSQKQIMGGAGRGSGCGFDSRSVWTRTTCGGTTTKSPTPPPNSVGTTKTPIPSSLVLTKKAGSNNYASCAGVYKLTDKKCQERPVYVSKEKQRFLAFNGRKWIITSTKYMDNILGSGKKGFGGFYGSVNGNVDAADSQWKSYSVKQQSAGTTPTTTTTTTTPSPTKGAKCYGRGKCNYGYMDKTNGRTKYWACGSKCKGGKYRTDGVCNCACIPRGSCPAKAETNPFDLDLGEMGDDIEFVGGLMVGNYSPYWLYLMAVAPLMICLMLNAYCCYVNIWKGAKYAKYDFVNDEAMQLDVE